MRVLIVLCAVIMACLAPVSGSTQMLPGMSTLQSFLESRLGELEVTTGVKAGVQRLSASLNVPIPNSFDGFQNRFNFETMDASVLDGTLWVGGVSLTATVPGSVVVYAEAAGNAKRKVLVETNFAGDVVAEGFVSPWEWTGSDIEWWNLDFGFRLNFLGDSGLVGGFRFDHTDVHLRDPRNVNGPIAGQRPYDAERRFGDLQMKLWIPYFGIGGIGPSFEWSLVGAPFAWTRVEMPLRWITSFTGLEDFSDSRYRVNVGGARFIELNAVYFASPVPNLTLDFWFKANWFGVDGTGRLDSVSDLQDTVLLGVSGSADAGDARVRRTLISGGLSASLDL